MTDTDRWTEEQETAYFLRALDNPKNPGAWNEPDLEEYARYHAHVTSYTADLMEKDPRLPYMSAVVIAGDLATLRRSKVWVEHDRMTFAEALPYVGSFGRFQFLLWGIENGRTTAAEWYDRLCSDWSAADPDDTDPVALQLFKDAKAAIGEGEPIYDDVPLPPGKRFRIYRGQDADGTVGFSWSTDLDTAAKFARGAGTRQGNRNGNILVQTVLREHVLAYITGRKEFEVIVDPEDLQRSDKVNPRARTMSVPVSGIRRDR